MARTQSFRFSRLRYGIGHLQQKRRPMFTLPRKLLSWTALPELEKLKGARSSLTSPISITALIPPLDDSSVRDPSFPQQRRRRIRHVPHSIRHDHMKDPLVLRYKRSEKPQDIHSRFQALPPSTQDEIFKLHVLQNEKSLFSPAAQMILEELTQSTEPEISLNRKQHSLMAKALHLYDILATNAFELLPYESPSPAGLFLNASRLNHSCVPNADHYFTSSSGYKTVFANRALRAGEEITISYIDHTQPRARRARNLKRAWGFECRCPACDECHSESVVSAHEEFLRRFEDVYRDPVLDVTGRLSARKKWEGATLERAAERARERIEVLTGHHSMGKFARQAYMAAADIAVAQYKVGGGEEKLEEAVGMVERVVELDVLYEGENSAVAEEHRGMLVELREGRI